MKRYIANKEKMKMNNQSPTTRYEAYDETYWNSNGRYEELRPVVTDRIPASGEIEDVENFPELERFRKMANAYYDLYNNGGCNLHDESVTYFGVAKSYFNSEDIQHFANAVRMIEDAMDAALLAAYVEIKTKGCK